MNLKRLLRRWESEDFRSNLLDLSIELDSALYHAQECLRLSDDRGEYERTQLRSVRDLVKETLLIISHLERNGAL